MKKTMIVILCITLMLQGLCMFTVTADTYAGTESPFDCPPSCAFDNQPESKWCTELGSGAFLMQTLEHPESIWGYYFCTGKDTNEYPGRNPVSWRLSASVDGENWVILDEKSGDGTLERVGMKYYYFWLDRKTDPAYSSYRFDFLAVSDGNVIQLSEVGVITDTMYEKMTETSAYTFLDGTKSAYECPPSYLFDGQVATKWCIDFYEDGEFVEWKMNEPVSVLGYRLSTAADSGEDFGKGRTPVSWVIYGSADREHWNVIDERTDDRTLKDVNCETYTFGLKGASAKYLYFRFCPLKVAAPEKFLLQLSELELIRNRSDLMPVGTGSNAFDGNTETVWRAEGDHPALEWSYSEPRLLTSYTLCAGTTADVALTEWRLYGANRTDDWTQLDLVEGYAGGIETFTPEQRGLYRMYRLETVAGSEIAEFSADFASPVSLAGYQAGIGENQKIRIGAAWTFTDCEAVGFVMTDITDGTETVITVQTYCNELKGTVNGEVRTVVRGIDLGGAVICAVEVLCGEGMALKITPFVRLSDGSAAWGDPGLLSRNNGALMLS